MEIKKKTNDDYLKRINIVVEYINKNLDKELDLKKLAEISSFSPCHFHRIISGYLRESLGSYITRIRIETAAKLLRYSDIPVEEIAYRIGYEVPSSLSKIFKQYYGISPTEYRTNKEFIIMKAERLNPDLNLKTPKMVELEPKEVIYISLTGAYDELDFPGTWQRLWNFVKEEKLYSPGIEHIGIYLDDPKVTEASKLRSHICLTIHKPVQPKGEIGTKKIPGGKYAVFTFEGPYSNLGMVYDTIYSKWLPESGCDIRDVPMFEKYMNDPSKTAPEKLKTEIYIPVV